MCCYVIYYCCVTISAVSYVICSVRLCGQLTYCLLS